MELDNSDKIKGILHTAELCRDAHSNMKMENDYYRKWIDFAVIVLSIALTILVGFYYRSASENETLLICIFVLPSFVAVLKSLDNTIFHFTLAVANHGMAVQIWGNFIRETKFNHEMKKTISSQDILEIKKNYIHCMNSTPQIPNKKFLEYKKRYMIKLMISRKIDSMSLEDLERLRIRQ